MKRSAPASHHDDQELADLHDFYVWKANAAVSAGRDDLAWTLAQDFEDTAGEERPSAAG